MLTEVTSAIQKKQTINPRTVLGFYATVLGILLTGAVTATAVLATTETSTFLIPWLLGFAGGVSVLLLTGVFLITLKDPSKLMLTQVTGTEYAAIQRTAIVGDSNSGETLVILEEIATPVVAVARAAGSPIEVASAPLATEEQ